MYLSAAQMNLNPWSVGDYKVECLLEQGSGVVNEDVLLKLPEKSMFGVFDGATSLAGRKGRVASGGLQAATIAADTFRFGSGSLVSLTERANRKISTAFALAGGSLQARHLLWSTCMAVVRLHQDSLSYCRLGDAQILLVKEDGSHQLVTEDNDIDGQTLSLWKEIGRADSPPIHELLAGQIRKVRQRMNRDYGVLNGEPEALDFLEYDRVSLTGVSALLLFTDGLFIPKEDPARQTDWQLMADLYREGGLQEIRHYVRGLEKTDPCQLRFPRFKCHDDIGAIALRFS